MTNSPCARYFAVHGSWGGVPSLLDAVIINGVRWAGLQCPTAVSIEPQYRPCVAFSVSRPAVRSRGIRPRQRFRHTTRGRDSSLRGYNQISVTASVTSIATPTEINSPRCIPVLQAATTTIRATTARFARIGTTDRGLARRSRRTKIRVMSTCIGAARNAHGTMVNSSSRNPGKPPNKRLIVQPPPHRSVSVPCAGSRPLTARQILRDVFGDHGPLRPQPLVTRIFGKPDCRGGRAYVGRLCPWACQVDDMALKRARSVSPEILEAQRHQFRK